VIGLIRLLGDLMISLHFSDISRSVLKTKIGRIFMSISGVIAGVFELIGDNYLQNN